jgi:hypothetical protein
MAEDFVEVSVTREELNLGTLAVVPANGYYIARNGIGPGSQAFDKSHAVSPYVDGEFITHKRKQLARLTMGVNVRGANASQLHSRIQVLTTAMEQFMYRMFVSIDGVTFEWRCEAANWTLGEGGSWNDLMLRSYYQTVVFEVERMPD